MMRFALSSRLRGSVTRLLRRVSRQESGLAAVEFSLILPILVVLWIGGVEITQGLSVDRRLNNLASSIGDLVSRTKIVTYANVDNIFDIAPGAMFPYSTTSLQMRVSAVKISTAGAATIAWSRAEGPGITAYATGQNVNSVVPASLRPASSTETQIIMSEVFYPYRPAVGYVVTGTVNLNDRMYFVPRLVAKVQLCDNSNQNCVS
jgi:Flp pilus assembly protein TadG